MLLFVQTIKYIKAKKDQSLGRWNMDKRDLPWEKRTDWTKKIGANLSGRPSLMLARLTVWFVKNINTPLAPSQGRYWIYVL